MTQYLKAIYAAIGAGLVALQFAYQDDVLTTYEAIGVAVAVFGLGSVVWGVPNESPSKGGTP